MTDVKKLRELAEKATPGPWFHGAKNGEHKYCVYDKVCWTDGDGRHGETPNMVVHVSPDDGKYFDAAYIAAANPATTLALLDELERNRWQPIETAPKDGTAVLVMRNDWPGCRNGVAEKCNGHNTYVAEWWPEERDGAGDWICYMDAVKDPECPVTPTHWMPLPAPPAALNPTTSEGA